MKNSPILALVAIFGLLTACSTAYYSTMEKFGYDKREILVDRVEDARDQQEETRDQFKSTLDAFKDLTGFDGGELESKYDELNDRYEDSEDEADELRKRIDKIEDVAGALFDEWTTEAESIGDAELRSESLRLKRETNTRYGKMLRAMRKAESKMDPVLSRFKDHVLYLKHNLNARAISSLETQLGGVRGDVDRLVDEMEKSIAEADEFIGELSP